MNFLEMAQQRYSVRDFKDTPIEQDKLSAILEAARVAPTARNAHPQRIIVAASKEELAAVDKCTPCRYNAPTVFLVCYDKEVAAQSNATGGGTTGEVDAAIVTNHLMFSAWELGLGSCWVMHFDPAKTRELFKLPANIIPISFLPIGYAADSAQPAEPHFNKVSLDEVLTN